VRKSLQINNNRFIFLELWITLERGGCSMSEHYYAKTPNVKSERKTISKQLRGQTLSFITDAGVFSKGSIDFGSTLLVESFEMPDVQGSVLDIGCGYGPVGLTVASAYPERQVHMIDVNERAIALSAENAAENHLHNVCIYENKAFENVPSNEFALVLTNPPIRAGKDVVFSFYEQAYQKLVNGGSLWVVIQKKQGAPSSMKKMESLFGNVSVEAKQKGYYILKSIKS